MIAFLNGTLAGKTTYSAIIECGGVGFEVGMSTMSLSKLPETGNPVRVYTYLQVREDAMQLFGFATMEEKSLFERLISVSGVGPKVALAALSTFDSQELVKAIMEKDVTKVSHIPGVGKKTASRIILELQGTLETEGPRDTSGLFGSTAVISNVIEDLMAMGFTSAEAELACKGAPENKDEAKVLQYALKRLGAR